MAAKKPVVKAAQRAVVKAPAAKAPAKVNKPSGKYIGPEANKGRLPAGYKGPEKGKYYGPDSKKGANPKYKKPAGKPATANPGTMRPGTDSVGNTQPIEKTWINPYEELPSPGPQAPVAAADGSLVDPNQWESDQARLQAREEDQADYDAINAEEQDAHLTEQSDVATQESQRAARRLTAKRQMEDFQGVKQDSKKKLNTALAYRGMGRGSAYNRKSRDLANQNTATETGIKGEETQAEQDYTTNVGLAAQRKTARLNAVAPRKKMLADRAARTGIYTR